MMYVLHSMALKATDTVMFPVLRRMKPYDWYVPVYKPPNISVEKQHDHDNYSLALSSFNYHSRSPLFFASSIPSRPTYRVHGIWLLVDRKSCLVRCGLVWFEVIIGCQSVSQLLLSHELPWSISSLPRGFKPSMAYQIQSPRSHV